MGRIDNPGALAGATGTDFGIAFKTETYRNRAKAATALGQAIAECHPHDACVVMEAALDNLTEGHPYYPLCRDLAEAGFWADQATRNERKAFALANYTRLSIDDQAAFLAYVQRYKPEIVADGNVFNLGSIEVGTNNSFSVGNDNAETAISTADRRVSSGVAV